MKFPFKARALSFEAAAVQQIIQRALASAGLDMPSVLRDAPSHTSSESPNQMLQNALRPGRSEGRFELRQFSSQGGSRPYKIYSPAGRTDAPCALMVMLHGCTQSADDFAKGTQMNALADQYGFLVVYPEQVVAANPSRCWNWFRPEDQRRSVGEPALIAGIVREVIRQYAVDPQRIFVAGLSAGAAMAVVMGETYPELFAGIGAHSGLAYGSAHDIPSALSAMKGARNGLATRPARPVPAGATPRKVDHAVPIIVFHGDRDHTVQHANAADIVVQAQEAYGAQPGQGPLHEATQVGTASGGRRFSRTTHVDSAGRTLIESWTVHGAGHAWSGGHSEGSYTDRSGPDASAEMVRFMMALPRRGGSAITQ